jgi:hypothetical protein
MLECTNDVHKHNIWRHKQHGARLHQSRRKLFVGGTGFSVPLLLSFIVLTTDIGNWLLSKHKRVDPFLSNKLRQKGGCVLIKTSESLGLVFNMHSSLKERNKFMTSSPFGLYSCNFKKKEWFLRKCCEYFDFKVCHNFALSICCCR